MESPPYYVKYGKYQNVKRVEVPVPRPKKHLNPPQIHGKVK